MVYVLLENLPRLVIEKDMDDLFSRYGRVVSMNIKFPAHATTVALVEYASTKDGEDACKELQGFMYHANRLRTELWHNTEDYGPRSQFATQHRIRISDLPPSATNKDVKDLIAVVADVLAVEIDRRGTAWATFATHYDLERAIDKLDRTDYRGERLRVKRDTQVIPSDPPTPSNSVRSSTSASASTSAPSPATSRSRQERTSSSTRSRSRSRSPPRSSSRRRSSSRSPTRHRSSDRRSRSRSRSPDRRSSSRRYTSRSRSRSR